MQKIKFPFIYVEYTLNKIQYYKIKRLNKIVVKKMILKVLIYFNYKT